MLAFIIRRLLWLIPVLLLLSFITFGLMHIAPGGPWDTDPRRKQLDPRTEKALNEKFGLDKPIFFNRNGNIQQPWTYLDSQYFNYVWKIVRYGDFGPSYRRRGVDVVDILKKGRHPVAGCTVELEAERAAEAPKVFTRIHIHFVVSGAGLKAAAVERAVNLSAEKYCSATIMLRQTVAITHDFEIIDTSAPAA